MFNFETVWQKNRRLEGNVLFYQNKARQDALKIMQLENIIKKLKKQIEDKKELKVIKLKTTKPKRKTNE